MKEQKILYFDIINGISGDMTLATLLDLGVPKQIFLEELDKLNLGKEFKIEITDKFENGIKGTNVNVVVNEGHVHRNLIDIYDIIDKSTLNDKIKQNAKDIFMEVAKAEAKVHGTSIDKIHFHEVGAMDSIIDIVGSCILLDLLCVDEIYATKVPLGSGFVKCAHGVIPVPAPAVVEILKDVPVKFNNVKGECTTPTGAAIIKTVCGLISFVFSINSRPDNPGIRISVITKSGFSSKMACQASMPSLQAPTKLSPISFQLIDVQIDCNTNASSSATTIFDIIFPPSDKRTIVTCL